jgi:hypothetical protein
LKPKDRLVLAVAISIALHEVVAGLIPPGLTHAPASAEVVTHATILRVAIRKAPTPAPSPQPTSLAQKRKVVAANAGARQSRLPNRPALRVASRTSAARARPAQSPASKPVWDAASARTNAGARLASAGGTGNASDGAGSAGNGTGATAGEQPCGFVTFSDPHGSAYDTRTHGFWVDIRMSVRFADGTSQSLILDYPWYYASEAANPWSDRNLKDPGFPTRFQAPPSEKLASEPALVQYVMHHSTPEGLTLLGDCPTASPANEAP